MTQTFVTIPRFNSMKVRLKHILQPIPKTLNLFQFHEGPIKTQRDELARLKKESFNSMKVRLKLLFLDQ